MLFFSSAAYYRYFQTKIPKARFMQRRRITPGHFLEELLCLSFGSKRTRQPGTHSTHSWGTEEYIIVIRLYLGGGVGIRVWKRKAKDGKLSGIKLFMC